VPADIVTQILNFGLPAPIDVQIEGTDIQGNRQIANKILDDLRQVPGLTDLRIHQNFDYPKLQVSVDRTKAAGAGFTPRDVANSVLLSLSGSNQVSPVQFLNWQNGVNYSLIAQAPAILDPVPPGSAEHSHQRELHGASPDSGRHGLHRALERHGGDLALQHPARGGHLRLRAGPGISARWAATSRASWTPIARICPGVAS
jgi:hypothetical protein